MPDKSTDEVKEEIRYQTVAEFLESTPPNQLSHISDLSTCWQTQYGSKYNAMNTPEIQLHCNHENCSGIRFFRCESDQKRLDSKNDIFFYVHYRCSNCQCVQKIFSLAAKIDADAEHRGVCYKFGEIPPCGPPVSPKLITFIGPDRDAFLKGRTCENQGLGVDIIGELLKIRKIVFLAKSLRCLKKLGQQKKRLKN